MERSELIGSFVEVVLVGTGNSVGGALVDDIKHHLQLPQGPAVVLVYMGAYHRDSGGLYYYQNTANQWWCYDSRINNFTPLYPVTPTYQVARCYQDPSGRVFCETDSGWYYADFARGWVRMS